MKLRINLLCILGCIALSVGRSVVQEQELEHHLQPESMDVPLPSRNLHKEPAKYKKKKLKKKCKKKLKKANPPRKTLKKCEGLTNIFIRSNIPSTTQKPSVSLTPTSASPTKSFMPTNNPSLLPSTTQKPSVSLTPTSASPTKSFMPTYININIALNGDAQQSSTIHGSFASRAIDDNISGIFSNWSVTLTDLESNPWWELSFTSAATIRKIVIWNRTDCCSSRLDNSEVLILDSDGTVVAKATIGTAKDIRAFEFEFDYGVVGSIVKIQKTGFEHLSLAEVQVFGSING